MLVYSLCFICLPYFLSFLASLSNLSLVRSFFRSLQNEFFSHHQLIQKYANDLRIKCNINPDMNLLTKVTINCGPSIYNKDASMVSSTDPSEVETIRNNFLIKKLKLRESPLLDEGINQVFELYGLSNRNKYRAVVYYLLTKHFGKESIF